jgi:hypothetical protein
MSKYSATPRGHSKFSYRFSEVMSGGSIPVILADDWLLPFRPEAVDWEKCKFKIAFVWYTFEKACFVFLILFVFVVLLHIGAVIIPERQANQTLGILQGISKEEECKKRQACWDIYQKYMADDTKVIAGLIDGWESIFSTGKTSPLAGVQCQRGDNLCNGT